MTEPLFVYGTLRHAPLLAAVAGDGAIPAEPAVLPDHAVCHAVGRDGEMRDFPLFFPRPGAQAEGLLLRPPVAARARLDAYERAFGYGLSQVWVQTAAGQVEAAIYLPAPDLWRAGPDWSLAGWVRDHGDLTTEVAAEVMALLPAASPEAVQERYRMLAIRVASRRRARAAPVLADLRRRTEPGDVVLERLSHPYAWFFGVEEGDLRFRRFDGTLSPSVRRAVFVAGDAVTVLPYDPVTDRVMLVEQFRFGPFGRGDPNPWSLEPVAGRIDPRETPEQAARRETAEEARLELRELIPVASYYPSPGAVSEYLYSFVGLADLGAQDQGIGGLESEAEDIRAHVIGFDRLMALVASGEIENAPLLISALWLSSNRAGLRGG